MPSEISYLISFRVMGISNRELVQSEHLNLLIVFEIFPSMSALFALENVIS